jgi:hypothetical protein
LAFGRIGLGQEDGKWLGGGCWLTLGCAGTLIRSREIVARHGRLLGREKAASHDIHAYYEEERPKQGARKFVCL